MLPKPRFSPKMKPTLRTEGNVVGEKTGLSKFATITDLVQKWAQVVALIAAGGWAYYHFVLSGRDDWTINMEMTTEVVPYARDSMLLVVHVKSKNPTETRVSFDKSEGAFTLKIKKVPEGLKVGSLVSEDDGDVIATKNLMPEDGYLLLPHSEFDDMAGVVLPVGSTVSLNAEWSRNNDYVSVTKIVHLAKP